MSDWRPFEQDRDELERVERDLDANRCNLHSDCAAADAKVAAAGGRFLRVSYGARPEKVMTAVHCHVEDCEECFGC